MPNCFISYSSEDERFAQFVAGEVRGRGLTVSMASDSLRPGDKWAEKIKRNMRASGWVILLASRAACQSPWVQQELGMAIGGSKKVVPVVWDMPPSQLPGWVDESQALDLRDADPQTVRQEIFKLAERIRINRDQGLLIAGALVLGLIVLGKGN